MARGEVLIVDDTPENLQVLGAILRGEGLSVRLAPSGTFALRSVAARRPDLILLDIHMPGLDGIETCRRLRADPATCAIPVLFLSASQEPAERLASFAAGGLDFIPKPFNADEVLARVSTHLTLASLRSELAVANARLAAQVREETTQRHRAEDVARDRQIRLDLALSAAGMGTWAADAHEGEIRLGLEAWALLGTPHAYLRQGWRDLVAGFADSERAGIQAAWLDGMHSGAVFEVEGWWQRPDGQRRLRIRGRTLGDGADQERDRVVGLIWDVTDEFQLHQRLAQSEKLEALGQLAGGLAHDFNNHLTVILGNLELVRRKTADARIIAHLSSIDRAAMTATALVRDLLTFARRREVSLAPLALAPVVGGLETLLRSTLGQKHTLVLGDCDAGLVVVGNGEQLQNALLNLCVNARDAMAAPGEIRVAVTREVIIPSRCRIGARDVSGTFAVITVTDTGSGIPEALQDRVFEPFFTTKPEGKGTGLGLATVVGCVKSHQGHLLLDSQPGLGTRFRILLPIAAVAP